MAGWDQEQKTEQPTPRRREEARRRGHGPRSRDLYASVGLLSAFLCLRWLGPGLLESARSLLGDGIAHATSNIASFTIAGIAGIASSAVGAMLLAVLPVMAGACAMTAAAGIVQGAGGIHFEALGPDFSRLDPLEGARKLFGIRGGARGLFALLKLVLVGWLLARALITGGLLFEEGLRSSAQDLWAAGWREAATLGIRISLALAALGLVELGFQRWMHERELRMSRNEILEEITSLEGNPERKRQRKRLANQMKLQSSRVAVKGA